MTSEEFWGRIKALKPFDYIDKSDPDEYVKACADWHSGLAEIMQDFEKERNLKED